MSNSQSSSYKGYAITTRWMQIELETSAHFRQPRFDACFCVNSPAGQAASWQAFPKAQFSSSVAAAANSRILAMESIDTDIAEHVNER